MFFFKNWTTRNFKNGVHQQEKALNKSTRFVINQKLIPTSHSEGFLEKYLLPFESVSEKIEQKGFHQLKQSFFKILVSL